MVDDTETIAPDAEWKIAKITNVSFGYEDHGILTCMLHLDYGGSAQGAGGYALDELDKATKERRGTAYGLDFIIRTMRAVGVEEWGQLTGKTIYALSSWSKVYGIKPLPTEKGEEFIFASLRASEFDGIPDA